VVNERKPKCQVENTHTVDGMIRIQQLRSKSDAVTSLNRDGNPD
jgi:hypothetical protein